MSRRRLLINLSGFYYRRGRSFVYRANFKSGKLSNRSRILPAWACSFPDEGSLYQQIISLSPASLDKAHSSAPRSGSQQRYIISLSPKRGVTFTLDPVLMERFAFGGCVSLPVNTTIKHPKANTSTGPRWSQRAAKVFGKAAAILLDRFVWEYLLEMNGLTSLSPHWPSLRGITKEWMQL